MGDHMSKREYLGDDGKFKPALLADALLKKTKFITTRETEEILWYNEHLGIWETNGQAVIGRLARQTSAKTTRAASRAR